MRSALVRVGVLSCVWLGIAVGAAAPAFATAVPLRGFEAETMTGSFFRFHDPSASDGRAIVLNEGRFARESVDLLASNGIELTISAGCDDSAQIALTVDNRAPINLRAGAQSWHVVDVNATLTAGTHEIKLTAKLPSGERRPCALPRVDRIDFIPASTTGDVMLGAAMRASNLALSATYRSVFLNNFDSLTPENELKMAYVEPLPGLWDFGPSDALVDFAHDNGKQVRGHTLVYGQQLPLWVRILPWSKAGLLGVMRTYITTVMHRYAGEINTWDVVNEAINADGSYAHNIWYNVIGPSYIADAFEYAHAADPSAELFYNDPDGEDPGVHSNAIIAMVRNLQKQGVPIDGIGLEDHTKVPGYPAENALFEMMRRYAALGLRIEITELDISTLNTVGSLIQKEDQQADAYWAETTACWEVAACQRVTTWGEYDGLSWLGSAQAPLLFNTLFDAKPALFAVEGALHRLVPASDEPWAGHSTPGAIAVGLSGVIW